MQNKRNYLSHAYLDRFSTILFLMESLKKRLDKGEFGIEFQDWKLKWAITIYYFYVSFNLYP